MPTLKQDSAGSVERGISLLLLLSPGLPLTRDQIFTSMSSHYDPIGSLDGANRMFKRDLERLRGMGFDIQYHEHHYQLNKGTEPGSIFLFSSREIEGLALLHTLFSDPIQLLPPGAISSYFPLTAPSHPFSDEILGVIDKLVQGLPEAQRRQFEQSTKRPYLFLHVQLAGNYLNFRPVMDFFLNAIQLKRQVGFSYLSRESEQANEYTPVSPHYIEQLEEQFYLIASLENRERRYFRLDRFVPESLSLLPMSSLPLPPPPRETIRFWIHKGLLKADRKGHNRRVSERWRSQCILEEDLQTDRVLVEVVTENTWRAKKYFLGLGSQAVVISPPDLVRELAEEIEQMAQSYKRVRSGSRKEKKHEGIKGGGGNA